MFLVETQHGGLSNSGSGSGDVPALYYESHVTIEPVFGERLVTFNTIAAGSGFRVATLLMQKDREDSPTRSDKDSFCTGHSMSYENLFSRMTELVEFLQAAGFEVWRAKIEAVLYDKRYPRTARV